MSQQGERRTGRDDDWWGQLYDDATQDVGPAPAPDTLDDRFASAADAVQEAAPEREDAPGRETDPGRAGAPGRETDPAREDAPARPAPAQPLPAQRSGDSPGDGLLEAPTQAPEKMPSGAPTQAPEKMPSGAPTQAPEKMPSGALAQAPEKAPREAPAQAPQAPEAREKTPREAPAQTPLETPREAREKTLRKAPEEAPREAPAQPAPEAVPPPRSPARPATPPTTPVAPAPWEPPEGPRGPVTFGSGAGPVMSTEEPGAAADGGLREDGGPREPEPRSAGIGAGIDYVGDGPPTYEAEPTVLPAADPDDLGDLVADTVLDGARYGTWTLRAASLRGDSARYRGEPRRDFLLTARFGSGDDALLLVAMATGARATPGAHRAAAEACAWIGRAVGRSHRRLAEDIRAARRGDLKSGLHRLTDRSLGRLRAHAADLGLDPGEYAASLRCLLLPADPRCRTRVFFGVGAGGLFRLRDGAWQDIEPRVAEASGEAVVGFGSPPPRTAEGDRLTMDLNITTPPSPYEPAAEPPREPFRFRASVARPGDTLLLCSGGLAEPLRGEPELPEHLTRRWHKSGPPGLADFLADVQVRAKGYADDRTAAGVWEA
ncbi:protein phosphatase 2C domain-containing protein [Streptomyces sp. A1499]|uniref:protein phosphatase 2C domain-containing protein n=1 Tax=Streptomyces sp. A1499 TaxID=2563104 RepID=UPI00144A80F8|nr:protein phosphatase 2C domain-containing protein [Streptomyces sp. A1499]